MEIIRLTPLYREVINGSNIMDTTINIPITPETIITPEKLLKYNQKLRIDDLYGFNANISCESKPILVIKDFDYFSLISFSNANVLIKYLKVYNAKEFCRLNGIVSNRIDIESSNCLLFDSIVNEFNYGIEQKYNYLNEKENEINLVNSKFNTIDIRNSKVTNFSVYIKTHNNVFSDVNINRLEYKDNINTLQVNDFSEINNLLLDNNIDSIVLRNSQINSLIGAKNLKIFSFKNTYSTVNNVSNIYDSNFALNNYDTYDLLRKSYNASKDYEKYSKYSFLQKDIGFKNEKKLKSKVFLWILRNTCGYGYKISNSIIFSLIIILLFSLIFSLITYFGKTQVGLNITNNVDILSVFLNSLYHSIVTFATLGYGDTIGIDWITKFLSAFESLLGIYSMSIIIYTLTKSYSND